MSTRETIYTAFYIIGFFLAVLGGVQTDFTGTHTPPLPFIIEFLLLPIGVILFIVDAVKHRTTTIHKFGLAANGLIMLLVLLPLFM